MWQCETDQNLSNPIPKHPKSFSVCAVFTSLVVAHRRLTIAKLVNFSDFQSPRADLFSDDAAKRYGGCLPVREFLAADVEGVESVRAVGAVFEEVFFCLPKVGLIARTGYADKRAPTLADTSYFSSDRKRRFITALRLLTLL